MRPLSSRSFRVAAAMALVAVACSYPTDNSAGAWVTVSAPSPVLIRGRDTVLTAHVYVLQNGHDTVEVKNVAVTWSTSDSKVAEITPLPGRQARVTGVNPGAVTIGAVAATLQSATAANLALRVASPLEVDSVRPAKTFLKYGEQVTVFGVGAEATDALFLGPQVLSLNQYSGVYDSATGSGRRRFWLPFPARSSDSLTAIGSSVISFSRDTILVDGRADLFDPNSASPATIDLDLTPFKSDSTTESDISGFIAFANPALYAEEPAIAPFNVDWFRFVTTQPNRPYTFIYLAPGLFGREATFLTAPVTAATLGSGAWSYGSGHYNCKGNAFTVAEVPGAGFQAAFTRLPAGGADLVSLFIDRGAYALIIVRGYLTTDRVRADRFEGNNTCDFADSNFVDPARKIDLGAGPFSDTLTIDNDFDIDWLRFRVGGAGPQLVTVKLFSKSVGLSVTNTSDDVLYVTNIPAGAVPLTVLKSALTGGTNKSLSVTLTPGDYYLVVHDSVGVAGRYSLCMAVGASCVLPALPDVAASDAPAPVHGKRDMISDAEALLARAHADARTRRAPPLKLPR